MASWIYLVVAILFEVAGTTSMKFSEGFSRLTPTILIFVFYALSLSILTLALKHINISVAYAIWSGMGTALIAIIGFVLFREPITVLKLTSIGLVIAGVVGLNLSGNMH